MLDDLSHTAGELIVRKCAKYGHIRVYKLRHVESAYHIFVGIKVYTGLSAYSGVHLGQQCCRDLDKIHAAEIGCSHKSAEVSRDTAA